MRTAAEDDDTILATSENWRQNERTPLSPSAFQPIPPGHNPRAAGPRMKNWISPSITPLGTIETLTGLDKSPNLDDGITVAGAPVGVPAPAAS